MSFCPLQIVICQKRAQVEFLLKLGNSPDLGAASALIFPFVLLPQGSWQIWSSQHNPLPQVHPPPQTCVPKIPKKNIYMTAFTDWQRENRLMLKSWVPGNSALRLTMWHKHHFHQAFELDAEKNSKRLHKDPMFYRRIWSSIHKGWWKDQLQRFHPLME